MDPIEEELARRTKECEMSMMLGAPEVLRLGQNLIRLIRAERVLDIGTFTGASAVAWSLALPANGHVLSMDITHSYLSKYGEDLIKSREDISKKIEFSLGSALQKLDDLLENNEKGKWDLAFIDADKANYPHYYERCVELLRPGGIIMIDNALWGGSVLNEKKDAATKAIDRTNQMAKNDPRVDNILLNLGDGLHLIFKK